MFYRTFNENATTTYVCQYPESVINTIQDGLVSAAVALQLDLKTEGNLKACWILLNLLKDIRMAQPAKIKFQKDEVTHDE